MSIEAKLTELGLKLPNPPAVAGSYVPWVRTGNLLYLAGTISSFNGEMTHVGQVGKEQNVQAGYESAKICALNALANIKAATGNLQSVKQFVLVSGDPAKGEFAGQITAARLEKQIKLLQDVGVLDKPVKVDDVATFEFIPKP